MVVINHLFNLQAIMETAKASCFANHQSKAPTDPHYSFYFAPISTGFCLLMLKAILENSELI